MLRTLVLNTNGVPLSVISWQRAICLVLQARVQQLEFYHGRLIHDCQGREYRVPAVVIRKKYVHREGKWAPFTRMNVFKRDGMICQYCGDCFEADDLTLDHVLPKSKSGKTAWNNIVTCCRACNHKKADKTCEESNMHPSRKPFRPSYLGFAPFHQNHPREWAPYLGV